MREGVNNGRERRLGGYNGIHTIVLASTMHTRVLSILLSYSSIILRILHILRSRCTLVILLASMDISTLESMHTQGLLLFQLEYYYSYSTSQ
mgnify:CR=1 FL=1